MLSAPILFRVSQGDLADADEATFGAVYLSSDAELTSDMATVADLATWEVDVADAPAYTRPTFGAVFDNDDPDGRDRVKIDPLDAADATANTLGAPSVAAIAFYWATGGADNTLRLCSALPVADHAGMADDLILAPNGFASVGPSDPLTFVYPLVKDGTDARISTDPQDPDDLAEHVPDDGDVFTVVDGLPRWATPADPGGSGGAVGSVTVDKTGSSAGAISVDLTGVAASVATVVILAPDGGPSTLNVGLPSGTDRGLLAVIAYAADESPLTLAFPSAPGAPTFGPAALPGVTVASTGAMTPIGTQAPGPWNYLLAQPADTTLPGWCSTEGFGEPGLRWRYIAGQIEFGGSAAWLDGGGSPALPDEPVITALPPEARPESTPPVVAMEFDFLGVSPTYTNVFSPGSINAATGEIANTTSPISALVRFAYLRWDIYSA